MPSAGVRGNVGCGTWQSHGAVLISADNACDLCNSTYPISITSAGCAFSFDRPIRLSGYDVISCNNTYPQYGHNSIAGFPLGTHMQGIYSLCIHNCHCTGRLTWPAAGECNATLLPTVAVGIDATDGTRMLSWYRPLVVRATTSNVSDVVYDVPFDIQSEIAVLSANSSTFRFAAGMLLRPIYWFAMIYMRSLLVPNLQDN